MQMAIHALTDREVGYFGFYPSNHYGRFACSRQDELLIVGRKQEPVPPLSCKFSTVCPYRAAVVDEDGGIMIIDTLKRGPDCILKEWQGYCNAIFDVDWTPQDAYHLVTCGGDQNVTLWDVESETKVVVMKGHQSSVRTVQYLYSSNAVLVSGSRDGRILIWDTRVSKKGDALSPVNAIAKAHTSTVTSKEAQHSVTAVVFQDEHTLISAASADRNIQVWDLRKNYTMLKNAPMAKQTISYAGKRVRNLGYSSLVLDSSRSRLFANCLDNTIYEFSLTAPSTPAVSKFQGHYNSTFYIRSSLSHDDRYLLTGSSDGNAYIYAVDCPAYPPWLLCGHSEEVSHGLWHPADPGTLVTYGDDCRFRTWRLLGDEETVDRHDFVGYAESSKTVEERSKARALNVFSPSKVLRATHSPRRPSLLSPAAKMAISRLSNSASSLFTTFRRSLTARRRASVSCNIASGLPTPKKLTVTPMKGKVDNVCTTPSSGASVAKRKLYDDDYSNSAKKNSGDGKLDEEGIRPLFSPLTSPSFVNLERAGKHCPLLANIPNLVFEGGVSRVSSSFNSPTPPPARLGNGNWLNALSSSKRRRLAEINGDSMVPATESTPPHSSQSFSLASPVSQSPSSVGCESVKLVAPGTPTAEVCRASDVSVPSPQPLTDTPKSQASDAGSSASSCGKIRGATPRTGSNSRSRSSQGSRKIDRSSEKWNKSVKNILTYFRPQSSQ